MALDAEAATLRSKIDLAYRADITARGALTNDFALTGNEYELRSQAIAATLATDKEASFLLSASQNARQQKAQTKRQEEKRRDLQHVTLTLVEQARQLSEQLARDIKAFESAFEADFGDAWREEIANRVMEPDAIPQRWNGESMKDYRERLEALLIATMIDPATGTIKPEYQNDPETARYAEWAQAKHRKAAIDNASDAELEELISSNPNWLELQIADDRAALDQAVGVRTAEQREAVADTNTEEAAFPPPGG